MLEYGRVVALEVRLGNRGGEEEEEENDSGCYN